MINEKLYTPVFTFKTNKFNGKRIFTLLLDDKVIKEYPVETHARKLAVSMAKKEVEDRRGQFSVMPILRIMQ
jgi:hypothetical protein